MKPDWKVDTATNFFVNSKRQSDDLRLLKIIHPAVIEGDGRSNHNLEPSDTESGSGFDDFLRLNWLYRGKLIVTNCGQKIDQS